MYSNFSSLFHTVFIGGLSYLAIVALLRLSGKRTLSKWNAFDFVVTIAYGSILATLVLSRETPFLQGILGIGILLLLQFALTWVAARSPILQNWVKAQPRLLVSNGKLLTEALLEERVTEGEVMAAVRAEGISSLEAVGAVVLETDGSFSVISDLDRGSNSAMADVAGFRQPALDA